MTVAVITQSRKDREFRRRRRLSRANRKVRDRRENSMRRDLKSWYVGLQRTVMERVRKVGSSSLVVEEIFRPSEFQEPFRRVILPQITRTLFAGIKFEEDFIRTLQPEEALQGAITVEQVKGPENPPLPGDIELPPGIKVELTPALRRKIAETLQERSVGVWNKVGPSMRRHLQRAIQKSIEEGVSFNVMEKRIRKSLQGLRRAQPAAIARTETTRSMSLGSQFEREELQIPSKQWISTIDSKNRGADPTSPFDHLSPDGQVVANNEAFLISKERIPVPADGSLGASPGNLVNCRCSAGASLKRPRGVRGARLVAST